MRLIDADEAVKIIKKYDDRWIALDTVIRITDGIANEIEMMPTVEAEQVRHGKWIVTSGGKVCTCPVCGYEFDNTCNYDIRKDWKRCPVCETKLEGD